MTSSSGRHLGHFETEVDYDMAKVGESMTWASVVWTHAGVAPIMANSGQVTNRYRLNRYGDRQLNRALHIMVQSQIRYDAPTRDYVARRTAEGKTGREIKRCLARYVARDLYRLLESGAAAA